ncbi:hypothetical protein A0257_12270 [Hymenobacter psoromatis]|nr:hypothetical protein A0257_12270 [Hymenobacter psoromatis]
MQPIDRLDFTTPKLAQALRAVQQGGYAAALPELSLPEKALLYYYTRDGSEAIKDPLRQAAGSNEEPLGQALAAALAKLPPYRGPVYSAEWWNEDDLKAMRLLAAIGLTSAPAAITWPTFLSASTSRRVALEHLTSFVTRPKNCLLYILSKSSRYVDAVSHRGENSRDPAMAEREVLFLPNTRFRLVNIRQATTYTEIELLEL